MPLKRGDYMCDKIFHIDNLIPFFNTYEDIGVTIILGEDVGIYTLNGTNITKLSDISCHRQKRQTISEAAALPERGQSAHRFQMIRLDQIQEYVKKTALRMNTAFLKSDNSGCNVKYIIVGGSREIKNQVIISPFLDKKIKSLIKIDVVYTGGLSDISKFITLCQNKMNNIEDIKLSSGIDKFLDILTTDPNKVIYGKDIIKRYYSEGLIKELFIFKTEDEKKDLETKMEYGVLTESKEEITSEITYFDLEEFSNGYGKIVGILWYPITDSIRTQIEDVSTEE